MEYSSKYKLFLRLLTSPIILILLIVTFFVNTIKIFIQYIRYGGELINYNKNEVHTIQDIYNHLKKDLQ